MKLKFLKKSSLYLIIFIIGIPLNVIGIILLINAINGGDSSQIVIKSVILLFWIFFTLSNLLLYKKEKKRESAI